MYSCIQICYVKGISVGRNMWPSGSWPSPSLNTRGGPTPFQPLLSRGSWPPTLITRGGSTPFQSLPVQRIWTSPSNHQKGLCPLPAPSAQGSLWSPPPLTRGAPPPSYPLPSPYIPGLAIGESVYWEALNKDGSEVDCNQSSTLDNVCKLLLSHFRKLYLKCCQIIGCLVLITIVF